MPILWNQRRAGIFGLLIVAFVMGVSSGAAQSPSLTFYDLSTMTRWPLGQMQARGAMGKSASIAVAELPAGLRSTPHHHNQEQILFGVGGNMKFAVGGVLHPLPRMVAAVTPPNVEHGNVNDASEPATVIEFQAVLRHDWFPPRPSQPRQGTPAPLPVPAGRRVAEDFTASSTGWRTEPGGARSKVLSGETIRVTVWDLSSASSPVDVTAGPAVERFVFVLDGQASIAEDAGRREVGREMLVIVPAAVKGIQLTPASKGSPAMIAVFQAIAP